MSRQNAPSRNAQRKGDSTERRVVRKAETNNQHSSREMLNVARLEGQFNSFVESLGDTLLEITALEVNTMIVDRITADKFIPWDAYRALYGIDRAYLEQNSIHESLRDRYLELRRHLELNYSLALANPDSTLYDPVRLGSPDSNRVLTDANFEINEHNTQLPNPFKRTSSDDLLAVQRLLCDIRFLRSLRKLKELKAALDNRNAMLLKVDAAYPGNASAVIAKAVKTDTIYAQTIVQLDGEIINRYSEMVIDHPHKDLLLKIHHENVAASERQWRGLLGFAIDIARKAIRKA